MTRLEQQQLVVALSHSIMNDVVRRIESGQIPAEWDGHELRDLMADKWAYERTSLMKHGRSARVKAYKNTCATENL